MMTIVVSPHTTSATINPTFYRAIVMRCDNSNTLYTHIRKSHLPVQTWRIRKTFSPVLVRLSRSPSPLPYFLFSVEAISWWTKSTCVLCMYEYCVGVGVRACDGFTMCKESLYGTERSRIWKELSGLGYCWKVWSYYVLLFLCIPLFLCLKVSGRQAGYI